MGGVTSTIALKFAFFSPQPPSYPVVTDRRRRAGEALNTRERAYQGRRESRCGGDEVEDEERKRGGRCAATMLYSHGNAEDWGQMLKVFVELSKRLRIDIMGFDYSGNGQSTGKPAEYNTYAYTDAIYKCLKDQYGIKDEQLVFGQSAGCGATIDLASCLPN